MISRTRCGAWVSGSVKKSGHVVHVTRRESPPKNISLDVALLRW